MMNPSNDAGNGFAIALGMPLPEYAYGPVTRTMLALFAGASGDHAPMHLDPQVARDAGFDDVFVHGMLCMAWLGQALRQWVPEDRLRRWGVRFVAVTPVHATAVCHGEVVELFEEQGEALARLHIGVRTGEGVRTLEGEAIVALQTRGSGEHGKTIR